MTMTTHEVAPEEVMAWVDGELAASEARAMTAHVAQCAECAGVAAGFRRMSELMGEWSVEEAPQRVETAVMEAAEGSEAKRYSHGRPSLRSGRTWGTRRWTLGLGGALAAVLLLAVVPVWYRGHEARRMYAVVPQSETAESAPTVARDGPAAVAGLVDEQMAPAHSQQRMQSEMEAAKAQLEMQRARAANKPASNAGGDGAPSAPMIARTVSLTVQVKDVDVSRATVEALLARHHGYAAQMNASTAEGSARGFTASLRIPALELATALKELRGLGRVENESQSGEEVTQQHQDLAARLKNSRETEARLQAILQQRTGRISDVLEVEQEIARVRGEIESMEAEQAGLEHRVDFASVDLTLEEEYKAQFSGPEPVGTQMRNALVAGYRNAWGTVLGIVLFCEEFGPAILVWAGLLGLPAVWVWRRYRRAMRAG